MQSPLTQHKYTVGAILVGVGVFGMLGSITGRLAPMIGSLFLPNAVKDSTSNPPAASSGGPGALQQAEAFLGIGAPGVGIPGGIPTPSSVGKALGL